MFVSLCVCVSVICAPDYMYVTAKIYNGELYRNRYAMLDMIIDVKNRVSFELKD